MEESKEWHIFGKSLCWKCVTDGRTTTLFQGETCCWCSLVTENVHCSRIWMGSLWLWNIVLGFFYFKCYLCFFYPASLMQERAGSKEKHLCLSLKTSRCLGKLSLDIHSTVWVIKDFLWCSFTSLLRDLFQGPAGARPFQVFQPFQVLSAAAGLGADQTKGSLKMRQTNNIPCF